MELGRGMIKMRGPLPLSGDPVTRNKRKKLNNRLKPNSRRTGRSLGVTKTFGNLFDFAVAC